MKLIRRYTFRHMLFRQEELTFEEDGKVREIVAKIAEFAGPGAKLGQVMDTVCTSGIAEELFAWAAGN